MSKFRKLKLELRERLSGKGWRACLQELAQVAEPQEYVGPLMALLPQPGILRWRGMQGLGAVVPELARLNMEEARVVMRRLMWHMNEESGNLGWGIPESMAEILAGSETLAREFDRILFSYARDSGREDNYIDYAPLLQWCFWGAGRLAQARPDLAGQAAESFIAGLSHEDAGVRCQAALALAKYLEAVGRGLEAGSADKARDGLRKLEGEATECEDFDGEQVIYRKASQLAARGLALL